MLLLLVTVFLTGCGPDSKTESETGSSENQMAASDAVRGTTTAESGNGSNDGAATQENSTDVFDDRNDDMNKLRQVALSMHNFQAATRKFPMAAMGNGRISKDLSWRVLVLPYLELNDEYDKFDLSLAWDSAQNKPLVDSEASKTFEMGNGNLICAIKHETPPKSLRQVVDGASNTIAFMENPAADGSKWTSPEDIDVEAAVKLVKSLKKGEYLLVAMFDGSVRKIYSTEGKNVKDEEITALFKYRDGTPINQEIFSPTGN